MKEASGELSLTVVAIVGVGLVLAFVTGFLPAIFNGIKEKIGSETGVEVDYEFQED